MSDREKKLLFVALAVVFVLGNLLAFKRFYQPRMTAAEARLQDAEAQLVINRGALETIDLYEEEMRWLERYEPEPAIAQDVNTRLQQLIEQQAQRFNLELLDQDDLGYLDDPGLTYHRARYQVRVVGMEAALYAWLDRLHSPNEFRAITSMKLEPKKDDDTMIDCLVVVEQWFVPEQEVALR